jgi:hypothetical protein
MSGFSPVILGGNNGAGSNNPVDPKCCDPIAYVIGQETCCIDACIADPSLVISWNEQAGGEWHKTKNVMKAVRNNANYYTGQTVLTDVITYTPYCSYLTGGGGFMPKVTQQNDSKGWAELNLYATHSNIYDVAAPAFLHINFDTSNQLAVQHKLYFGTADASIFANLVNNADRNSIVAIPFQNDGGADIFFVPRSAIAKVNIDGFSECTILVDHITYAMPMEQLYWLKAYKVKFESYFSSSFQMIENYIQFWFANDRVIWTRKITFNHCPEANWTGTATVPTYLNDYLDYIEFYEPVISIDTNNAYDNAGGSTYNLVTYYDPNTKEVKTVVYQMTQQGGAIVWVELSSIPQGLLDCICKKDCGCSTTNNGGSTAKNKHTQGGDSYGEIFAVGSNDDFDVNVLAVGTVVATFSKDADGAITFKKHVVIENDIDVSDLEIKGNKAVMLSIGSENERPTEFKASMIRYNTDINGIECYIESVTDPNNNMGIWSPIVTSNLFNPDTYHKQGGNSYGVEFLAGSQDNYKAGFMSNGLIQFVIQPDGKLKFGGNADAEQSIDMGQIDGGILLPSVYNTSGYPDPTTTNTDGLLIYDKSEKALIISDGTDYYPLVRKSISDFIVIGNDGAIDLKPTSNWANGKVLTTINGEFVIQQPSFVLVTNNTLTGAGTAASPLGVVGGGGGLTTVVHDNTMTGNGTAASPLSVVGGGGGLTTVIHDNTITGNGTAASPLSVVNNPASLIFIKMSLPNDLSFNGGSFLAYWKQYGSNSNLSEFYNRTLWDLSNGQQGSGGISTGNFNTLVLKTNRKYRVSVRLTIQFSVFPSLGDYIELRLNTQNITLVQLTRVILSPNNQSYSIALDSVIVNLNDINIALYISNVFAGNINKTGSEIIIEEVF